MKKYCLIYAVAVCIFCAGILNAAGAGSSQAFYEHWINTNIPLINLQQDINLTDTLGVPRSADLTIDGLGYTLTLNNNTLIFLPNWNDGLNATIQNITINGAVNGAVEFNGDGQNNHTYIITNSTFTGNTSPNNGGAVYSHAQAQVAGSTRTYTFTDNIFTYNTAANGGALYNASNNSQLPVEFSITCSNPLICYFTANSAVSGSGGAVYNVSNYGSGSSLNNSFVIGSSGVLMPFTNNSAPTGYGGAIYNFVNNPSGGGINAFDVYGVFNGNNASYGGAVVNQVEGGNGVDNFTLAGSFTGNVAMQNGGAVANYVGLSGNAPYGGSNIFDLTGVSSFNNNIALNGSGGAIYNYINAGGEAGATNLGINVVFSGNSAADGNGGAIYNYAQNYSNAYSTIPQLNIADGTQFINNAAMSGGAVYNDGWGVVNFNSAGTGITFTGNTIAIPGSPNLTPNDIFQTQNGVINFFTDGVISLDGGIQGAGTVNKYGSGGTAQSIIITPAPCSPGSLCFAASSNSSNFTGIFNQFYGETDMFGQMFGGVNNIYNAPNAASGDITTVGAFGDSIVNVFASNSSFYYNANMFSNTLLNHTVTTSSIFTLAPSSGVGAPGLNFMGSGSTVNFYNGSGTIADLHLSADISNGQQNTINFDNMLVVFIDNNGNPVTNFTGGTTYSFTDSSALFLAYSNLPSNVNLNDITTMPAIKATVNQFTFNSFYTDTTNLSQLYVKVVGAGTNAAPTDTNFIADSLSVNLAPGSGQQINLSKLYIYDFGTLSGPVQIIYPQAGSADLTLTLDNPNTFIVTSRNVYTLGLTSDAHGIIFNPVTATLPPLDLNDANALTTTAGDYGMTTSSARNWQIDAGTYYWNYYTTPEDDPNTANGFQTMAAGTFNVYGSIPDDLSSVLSGDFSANPNPGPGAVLDRRSLFDIDTTALAGGTVDFSMHDMSVRDAWTANSGAVLEMNDTGSTADFRYTHIFNSYAENNGGAFNIEAGNLNTVLTSFTGNSSGQLCDPATGNCTDTAAGGNGGAINVDGGTAGIASSNPTTPLSSTDYELVGFSSNRAANGNGGAINQNGGTVTIQDIQQFYSNSADVTNGTGVNIGNGGAISHIGGTMDISAPVSGSVFAYNTAYNNGGAIYNNADGLTLYGNMIFVENNASFTAGAVNAANGGLGGAIYNGPGVTLTFNSNSGDSTFVSNSDSTGANDIYNDGGTIAFGGNFAVLFADGISGTGAIEKTGEGSVYLLGSNKNNIFNGTYTQDAGTLYVGTNLFNGTNTITGGTLFWVNTGVDTAQKDGALSSLNVTNSLLWISQGSTLALNNNADSVDGSNTIFLDSDSAISVEAPGAQLYLGTQDTWLGSVSMSAGNTTMDGLQNLYNSNYSQSGGELTLINNSVLTLGGNSVITGGDITLGDSASSARINTNGVALNLMNNGGNLYMNSNSTINAMDGVINSNNFAGGLTVGGSSANFAIDIDAKNKISDSFNFALNIDPGTINISNINLLNAPAVRQIPLQVFSAGGTISGITFASNVTQVQTPLGTYGFAPMAQQGWYMLSLQSLAPSTGDGQAAVRSMLNSQLLANDTLFDHVFFDSNVMLMDDDKCGYRFIPSQFLKENRSKNLWAKTYYENGSVPLGNGLDIKNDMYGYLMGIDFPTSDIGSDAYFMPTLYAGYNGAQQSFDNVDTMQDALQLGFMASLMKDDFTTSGMIYGGGYNNRISLAGYNDSLNNWFAGVAVKSAYNMYLDNFVIQPGVLASYNIYGQQNWDSSYGNIAMQTDYMNGFNVAPGMNLIYGLRTWNFLLSGSYMFNMGGRVSGKAGDIELPALETEQNYLEYGAGVSKIFSRRFSVWAKAVFKTNRGNDYGLRAGAAWKF
ncbi:MAG: hypothetical protein FWF35_03460 [Elusimicrobia bacterium]|nr:hypothetical protein [Elusimicrobiota bacterium]